MKSKEPILWSKQFYVEKAVYLKMHPEYGVKLQEILDAIPNVGTQHIVDLVNKVLPLT